MSSIPFLVQAPDSDDEIISIILMSNNDTEYINEDGDGDDDTIIYR